MGVAGRERRIIFPNMKTREQIIADAEKAGVDFEMLEHNLSLTHDERARQHDAALALVLELKHIGEEQRAYDRATP